MLITAIDAGKEIDDIMTIWVAADEMSDVSIVWI